MDSAISLHGWTSGRQTTRRPALLTLRRAAIIGVTEIRCGLRLDTQALGVALALTWYERSAVLGAKDAVKRYTG